MGAIVAVIGPRAKTELAERLEPMLQRSAYRGAPDRYVVDDIAIAVQTLGWDASLAQHEHWVVAFHGFVGNWPDLAGAHGLSLDGVASDAGRVAVCYARFGEAMFPWLRGEFALLIVDRKEQAVIAVRDVIGTRPLFHQVKDGLLFVASEIRQVLAGSQQPEQLNESACAARLLNTYFNPTDTLFVDVSRVAPAEIYRFTWSQPTPSRVAYWEPPQEPTPAKPKDYKELAEEARAYIEQALRRSLPQESFAVALSGGLDSAILWSILGHWATQGDDTFQRAHAYSLVFPGLSCDETSYIRTLLDHYPGQSTWIDASQDLPSAYDSEQLQILDSVPGSTMYQVCRQAQVIQQNACERVELTGIGGDELFGGSLSYLSDELLGRHWIQVIKDLFSLRLPVRGHRGRVLWSYGLSPAIQNLRSKPRQPSPPAWLGARYHNMYHSRFQSHSSGYPPFFTQRALLERLRAHQGGQYLEPREQGLAAFGLQTRYPYLDVDLITFAFRIPPRAFWNGLRYKHLLRTAADGIIPPVIRDRRLKSNSNPPVIRDAKELAKHINPHTWSLAHRGIVNPSAIRDFLQQYTNGHIGFGKTELPILLWYMERFVQRFDGVFCGVQQPTSVQHREV